MKYIFTLLFAAVMVSISASAQKPENFLQKAEGLLKQDSRVAAYEMNARRGTPESIRFTPGNTYSSAETERLLQTYFTGRKGMDEYRIMNTTSLYDNITVVRYQQYFKGVKVEFGNVVAVSKNELLSYMMAENYLLEGGKTTVPVFTESSALNKAIAGTGARKYAWQEGAVKKEDGGAYPKAELVLMPDMRPGKAGMVLAWKFDIYATEPLSRNHVYISAEDGNLLFKNSIIKHSNTMGTAATRYSGIKTITTNGNGNGNAYELKEASTFMDGIETYNMNRGTNYNAAVISTDNDNNWTATEYNNANKDNALLDAHWGAEQVVGYWKSVHNRNSYDNSGTRLKSYVHYSNGYDNAFWNGSVMTYGDGSGGVNGFSPLTSLDICAHEIGHAVCQTTCDLVYQGESGAMNEGFSDIWAACVENYADPANIAYEPFLIGEQITFGWIKGQNRNAVRDMANPKAQGNPDTYGGTYWNYNEVHNQSGVLNKWFYLMTRGGNGTNDLGNAYAVTALGFSKSQQIAFLTEISLTPNATYTDARITAMNATFALYQNCSQEVITVANAWYAVGIGAEFNAATTCPRHLSFLSAGATVSETVNSTACHPGKPVICTIILSSPITQNVTVTLNNFGTAVLGRDFTIASSSYTFVPGGSQKADFVITVYDNNIDEGDRSLILNYTIIGNGATAGNQNQTYVLKILDDDTPPFISSQSPAEKTLLNEPFAGTSLPSGWITNNSPAIDNKWVVGSKTDLLGNAAYITNNVNTKPWAYTKNEACDVYILSPLIDAANVDNMYLQFQCSVKGQTYYNKFPMDYGSVVYLLEGATTVEKTTSFLVNSTRSGITQTLYDQIFANKRFRIGFLWHNDESGGEDPPLAVNSINIYGTFHPTNVETAVNSNKEEDIVASTPVHFLSAQRKKIIARIANASASVGCVNVAITQAGSGQVNLTSGFKTYKRTSKVFNFIPALSNNTVTYRLRLYFTDQELAIWGNTKLNLKMLMVKSGVDLNSNISTNDMKLVDPILSETGDGYIAYTGDFTGFGQVMLVSPVTTFTCFETSESVVYVDSSKAESGDGSSWAASVKTLSDALLIATQCSSIKEIKIAKGTYKPTTDTGRDSAFVLTRGLKIYGGYPTGGGGDRNPVSNPTVLSGDIGAANSTADNSYHVLVVSNIPATEDSLVVDGFTITKGAANGTGTKSYNEQSFNQDDGAGVSLKSVSNKTVFRNCVFSSNMSTGNGGAVFNYSASPFFFNCLLTGNKAAYGGAIANETQSAPLLTNCTLARDTATANGGGLYNNNFSNPLLTNCIIWDNAAATNSVIGNGATSNPQVNTSIVQTTIYFFGGNLNADPLFVNAAAGNFQLQGCSPGINAGNSTALPAGLATDLAGKARIFNAAVDIGAYENVTLPATFTFKGAGNWTVPANWQCNWVPPSQLPSGSEIIIDPVGGECLLNIPYVLPIGGKLTVKTGKKLKAL